MRSKAPLVSSKSFSATLRPPPAPPKRLSKNYDSPTRWLSSGELVAAADDVQRLIEFLQPRFVNSLVDPLQTTYFARSMATLAAQLGLPLWFIEVRHAATHEDLPRLPVLRDAARQVSHVAMFLSSHRSNTDATMM